MKIKLLNRCWSALACSLIAGVGALSNASAAFTLDNIEYWVDHSSVASASSVSESVLVIDWNDGAGPLAWGFRWDASESLTGADMLEIIVNVDFRLDVDLAPSVYGMFFNTAAFAGDDNGNLARSASSDDTNFIYWAYSVYDVSSGEPEPWAEGDDAGTGLAFSSVGMSDRILSDGSYDVWRYSPTDFDFEFTEALPTEAPRPVSAIPEPSGVLLLIAGMAVTVFRRGR